MRDVVFAGDFFRTERDRPRSEFALMILLEALVCVDVDYLRRNPETPSLYASGVTYQRREEWCDVAAARSRGTCDCKSLAAWRSAELRRRGIAARCEMVGTRVDDDFYLYHVRVLWPAGPWGPAWIEDPSRVLGMGADEAA